MASPGSHAECQGLTVGLAKRGASRQRPFLFQQERPLKAGPTREKMFKDCENQKRYLGPHPKHGKGVKSPCFSWKSIPRTVRGRKGEDPETRNGRTHRVHIGSGSTTGPRRAGCLGSSFGRECSAPRKPMQRQRPGACSTSASASATGPRACLVRSNRAWPPPLGRGGRNRGVGGVTGYKGQPEFRIFF